jgi:hypothetical protein
LPFIEGYNSPMQSIMTGRQAEALPFNRCTPTVFTGRAVPGTADHSYIATAIPHFVFIEGYNSPILFVITGCQAKALPFNRCTPTVFTRRAVPGAHYYRCNVIAIPHFVFIDGYTSPMRSVMTACLAEALPFNRRTPTVFTVRAVPGTSDYRWIASIIPHFVFIEGYNFPILFVMTGCQAKALPFNRRTPTVFTGRTVPGIHDHRCIDIAIPHLPFIEGYTSPMQSVITGCQAKALPFNRHTPTVFTGRAVPGAADHRWIVITFHHLPFIEGYNSPMQAVMTDCQAEALPFNRCTTTVFTGRAVPGAADHRWIASIISHFVFIEGYTSPMQSVMAGCQAKASPFNRRTPTVFTGRAVPGAADHRCIVIAIHHLPFIEGYTSPMQSVMTSCQAEALPFNRRTTTVFTGRAVPGAADQRCIVIAIHHLPFT